MNRRIWARVAGLIAILLCHQARAQTFTQETTDLIEEFGSNVPLVDEDGDGTLSDLDFTLFLIDRVFEQGLEDHNCDGTVDEVDAVLGMSRELTSLASDFDRSGAVGTDDIAYVSANLGLEDAYARSGDINSDTVVDAADLLGACDRLGHTVSIDPVQAAYDILDPFLTLEPWMAVLPLDTGEPCQPELCGSALCKVKCVNAATGGSWTYRLFMVGFCGSQFEATNCCDIVKVVACTCSPDGFSLSCWVQAQGAFVTCLIAAPG